MFIFSNLAISLDGKIATQERGLQPLGTPYDRKQMQRLRAHADAILMGASTLRSFKKPCTVAGQKSQPYNLLISSTLEGISPEWPYFKDRKIKRILFVSERTPEKKRTAFAKTSTLIFLSEKKSAPSPSLQIIAHLKTLGIRNLLVEGGGSVMWDFAQENLIDSYHVTLTPRILGGKNSPTLVDGKGFSIQESLKLKLSSVLQVGDELYLTYQKTRKRGL